MILTPVAGRDLPYEQCISFKVSHSSKTYTVSTFGAGYTLKLSFDRTALNLGPIIPYFEGQIPNEQSIEIINPTDYPIEVVSLNFDERYHADESMLREYMGCVGLSSCKLFLQSPH